MKKVRHPSNAEGDFYVELGCCMRCDVPSSEAPGHFQFDDEGHCFVCKQPSGAEETTAMVDALHSSEVSCIRYAGNDNAIFKQLLALNEQPQCDLLADMDTATARKQVFWITPKI